MLWIGAISSELAPIGEQTRGAALKEARDKLEQLKEQYKVDVIPRATWAPGRARKTPTGSNTRQTSRCR